MPEDGQELEALLKRAELACKEGKASGHVAASIWDAEIVKKSLNEIRWRCVSCTAVVSMVVDSSRMIEQPLCANCGTKKNFVA